MALKVRAIFTIETLIFALTLAISIFGTSNAAKSWVKGLAVVIVIVYMFGAYAIVRVGYLGARIVHDYNIHNTLTPGFEAPSPNRDRSGSTRDSDSYNGQIFKGN